MSETTTFTSDTLPVPFVPAVEPIAPLRSAIVHRGITHTIINPGNSWETVVGQHLSAELQDASGHIFTGFEICDLRDRLIEIDNLLICDRGVFVIECKALRGRIEGGLNMPWKFVQGDQSDPVPCHRGLNPRHQCRQQMYALVEALKRIGVRRRFWVNGAVVVPDALELDLGNVPVDTYHRSGCPVYHLSAFARILAGLPRLSGPAGDPDELAFIVDKLRR